MEDMYSRVLLIGDGFGAAAKKAGVPRVDRVFARFKGDMYSWVLRIGDSSGAAAENVGVARADEVLWVGGTTTENAWIRVMHPRRRARLHTKSRESQEYLIVVISASGRTGRQ